MLSHVPFLLAHNGGQAELHLVRSNPIVTAVETGAEAVISVLGPDSDISPDWYGSTDQVPTWNYVAVHLRGSLDRRPDADMNPMLDRLSEAFETRLAPKAPWHSDRMSLGIMDRMMRGIVPFVFHVARIEGTWKLNQNKTAEARLAAADRVADAAQGADTAALAGLMREAD